MVTRARSQRRIAVPAAESPAVGAPRTGAKRTVMYYIRQLPQYLRAARRSDHRPSRVDGRQAAGRGRDRVHRDADRSDSRISFRFSARSTICIILVLALQRLISNAGRAVLLDHWSGDAGATWPT